MPAPEIPAGFRICLDMSWPCSTPYAVWALVFWRLLPCLDHPDQSHHRIAPPNRHSLFEWFRITGNRAEFGIDLWNTFQASTTQLEDQQNGLTYQISLQYGVGEEAAQISLGRTQGENVRCLRPDSEEFLWGMGDNGVTYRYDLRTVSGGSGRLSSSPQ